MFNEIPELDNKGLRNFGLIMGVIIAIIFGLFLPWRYEWSWSVWPWLIFSVFSLVAFINPGLLKPVYTVWMRFGLFLGNIMSRVILGIIFFLVITPLGLLLRIFLSDPMNRQYDDSLESYRELISDKKSNSFEKPF